MLEFITMLSIMAMGFCVATVLVAFIAGGLLRAGRAIKGRTAKEVA